MLLEARSFFSWDLFIHDKSPWNNYSAFFFAACFSVIFFSLLLVATIYTILLGVFIISQLKKQAAGTNQQKISQLVPKL